MQRRWQVSSWQASLVALLVGLLSQSSLLAFDKPSLLLRWLACLA